MSKLLIDDKPVMVLPKLAAEIGLNEAIVLQQMHYWIVVYREANKRDHHREGRWWIYNTKEEWGENFPWWSESTVWRILTNLRELGLVDTGRYNKKGFDRTLWYTVDYEELAKLEKSIYSKWENGSSQPEQMDLVNLTSPIPEINTETTSENTSSTDVEEGASAPTFFPEQFETSIADIKDLTFTMAQYQQMLQAEQDRGDDARVTLVDYLKRKTGGSLHPAIQIFREEMEHYPRKNQFDDIIERVGANGRLEFWRDVVNAWKLAGYNPYNVLGMLDCVERGELPNPQTTGGFNAKGRRTNRADQRGEVYEPTAEEVEQARADARRKLAELRRERAAGQTA